MSARLATVVGVIAFAFALINGAYIVSVSAHIDNVAANSQQALCSFRHDLQVRRNQTKAFVDSDTDGKVFGIPTSVLRQSLRGQTATLKSLTSLKC